MSSINRRLFLKQASAFSLGFAGLAKGLMGMGRHVRMAEQTGFAGYGPLEVDPDGILDLPAGFTYKIISSQGEPMADGLIVPGKFDGMCAFPGPKGRVILVRNHELIAPDFSAFGPFYEYLNVIPQSDFFDFGQGITPGIGGTTTLVHEPGTNRLVTQFLSLAGTVRNCSDGPTPWGSWLTCEESTQKAVGTYTRDHGFVFEVPAVSTVGRVAPVELTAMGRFMHEAAAVDPVTGFVYMTEDRPDGLLYRFRPTTAGQLAQGGLLEALRVIAQPGLVTNNHSPLNQVPVGLDLAVDWVPVLNVLSPNDTLRFEGIAQGAATFARGEGMFSANGSIFFTATDGGLLLKGQIWELIPGPNLTGGVLRLFAEPNNASVLENADNITVAPWGDLIICEDGPGTQFLVGVTPNGNFYKFARNALNTNEVTGATFSPDGSILYANIRNPGRTLAIRGPF
jgi:secreted PhoX family phosphatase